MTDRLGWVPEGRAEGCGCAMLTPPRTCQDGYWRRRRGHLVLLGETMLGDWVPDSRDDQVWRCFGVRTSETWGQHEQTWWARRMRGAHILLRDHETAEVE